ncbi:bifunctional diguanylate cyclase/phosphodiesterase [Treponema berlinense]|uniref:bifunctional diguanylate cyclase/phosphodiesterase n=1 Tax=Treponema berlinense TaxID=225004 RepID=UPI0026EEC7CB|nr:bifunctional diguanylate cyclase/phosphodiesterase [Treponema berlinense]
MNRRKSFVLTSVLMFFSVVCALAGAALLIFIFLKNQTSSFVADNVDESKYSYVLYISSYDPRYLITQNQLEGIEDSMRKFNLMYEVMYMDMLNYGTRENFELFYQTLKHKLSMRDIKYKALIVSDDAALTFVELYHDELFEGIPVVFFGVNNIEHAKQVQKYPWITGFGERIFVEDTIEVMVEQNSKLSKIYCILDDSLTGRGDRAQFLSAMKKYPNLAYEFITISRNSLERLADRLQEIESNAAILSLSSLQSYAHRNAFSVYELINFFRSYAPKIPVYRTNAVGIGSGFVGGKVVNHYASACRAVETINEILNSNKRIEDFPYEDLMDGLYLFDYAALKEFNIDPSSLPEETVFLNKPENLIKKNKNLFASVSLIILSLVSMLIVFIVSYCKSKKVNEIVMAMNKRMRQINKELIDSKTKLTFVANNDGLTELPNRSHGEEEIKKLITASVPFTLFLMDVDDFKNYNDTYTHACGDFVLKEFGRRLARLTVTGDYFAARYGGDEFLLVYKNGHIEKNGREIELLRQTLNEPMYFHGTKLSITATLGFADSQIDISYDNLLTNADIAMYEAKKIGNGTCLGFMPEMKETILKRNSVIDILNAECECGGFEIRYQPQVSTETGDVYGFEALVRLRDYAIGPDVFIPVAESSGYITQIGRIVTEKVLRQMAIWRKNGMKLRKVAINYSNGQLVDDGYVAYLKKLLDDYKIPANLIEIEITESLFMGKKGRASQLFEQLAEIGVGLALDDFGTGYSSLSYLTFVPANKVKIDKSLVDNYLVDGKEDFIQNIVQLVHGLGMKLTVEGVEHKWQYDKLCSMKCDYIQGYLFSKPMSADDVPSFEVAV